MPWSLDLKQIHDAAPDVVYLTVKNASSSTISVGHAAFYKYAATNGAADYPARQDLQVTLNATAATAQYNPGLFAGVAAKVDIGPGGFGYIQVHGPHPGVYLTGLSTNADPPPFITGLFTVTNRTNASFTNVILKPVNCFGNTTGAVASAGYFAPIQLTTTVAGTTTPTFTNYNHDLRQLWPGGYLIPLDNVNGGGTCATTSSCSIKAFVKCL